MAVTVPNYIKRFRLAMDIEAKELAERISVDPSTLSRWESHNREVPDEFKLSIASELGVPVGSLFAFDESITNEALRKAIDMIIGLRDRLELVEANLAKISGLVEKAS